jgi:DNA polymerase III subunit gamma/tau
LSAETTSNTPVQASANTAAASAPNSQLTDTHPTAEASATSSGKRKGSQATAPVGNQKEVNIPRSIRSIRTTSIHGNVEVEEQKTETKEEILLLNQPFTTEALQRSWNIFIETIKDDTHLVNFMKTNPPILMEDYQIELVVPNQVQEMKFQELTIPIEQHLRHNLKNNKIKMTIRMTEEGENTRPFTSRDKLEAMIQKNPNMGLLYRTLGLDLV